MSTTPPGATAAPTVVGTSEEITKLITALNNVTAELGKCLEKVEPKTPVVASSTVVTPSATGEGATGEGATITPPSAGGRKRRNSRKNAKKDANKRQQKSRRR